MRHQGNSDTVYLKSTNSKNILAGLVTALVFSLAGCTKSMAPEVNMATEQVPPYNGAPDVRIATPISSEENDFSLLRGNLKLHYGETEDNAFAIFGKPQGGLDFLEDSPIKGDSYSARGWQTTKESFAGVFLRDRFVLGMHTIEQTTLDKVNQIVDEYSILLAPIQPQIIPSEAGNCWFWDAADRRIMIANTKDGKKRNQVVIALGHREIMDALRMNPEGTRQDLFEAGRILEKR